MNKSRASEINEEKAVKIIGWFCSKKRVIPLVNKGPIAVAIR